MGQITNEKFSGGQHPMGTILSVISSGYDHLIPQAWTTKAFVKLYWDTKYLAT